MMRKPIPFYGLREEFDKYRQEYMSIMEKVLSGGMALQGPEVEQFESHLARLVGRTHVVATGSCTDALAFALLASGVGVGDEVLVTCFSFVASASAICRTGATPIFIDIDDRYYLMDQDALEKKLSPATKAILAVNLFGQTQDMGFLESFARQHGLIVIEDAAQSLGAQDGGKPSGSFGRASCFSFDPTKVIASFGSAGAIATDDEQLAEKARKLRYHGRDKRLKLSDMIGFNSQLSSDKAAVLDFKLGKLREWETARSKIAEKYRENLAGIDPITLPQIREGSSHNWHKFVIRAQRRDDLRFALSQAGIDTMIHYNRILPDEPCFSQLANSDAFENARAICPNVLSLPIYPQLGSSDVEHICFSIRKFYDRE